MAELGFLLAPAGALLGVVSAYLGGRVDLVITSATSGLSHIGPDRLRALAVTSSRRLATAPELPTVNELGYPAVAIQVWHGLLVPANTPHEVVQRLQDETLRALRQDENRLRLMQVGIDASSGTGDEFATLLRSDFEKYADVVKRAKLNME